MSEKPDQSPTTFEHQGHFPQLEKQSEWTSFLSCEELSKKRRLSSAVQYGSAGPPLRTVCEGCTRGYLPWIAKHRKDRLIAHSGNGMSEHRSSKPVHHIQHSATRRMEGRKRGRCMIARKRTWRSGGGAGDRSDESALGRWHLKPKIHAGRNTKMAPTVAPFEGSRVLHRVEHRWRDGSQNPRRKDVILPTARVTDSQLARVPTMHIPSLVSSCRCGIEIKTVSASERRWLIHSAAIGKKSREQRTRIGGSEKKKTVFGFVSGDDEADHTEIKRDHMLF
ncbi:hypothetical protein DFH06DRAFT_1143756 [Mycena polygramma]|nr:hypothetical protein DFH06DRAFT_1143756 [Mycena polygramma]